LAADVDYELEYNNRARVPENPAIIAGWASDAKAYREMRQGRWRVIPYGTARPALRPALRRFPAPIILRR